MSVTSGPRVLSLRSRLLLNAPDAAQLREKEGVEPTLNQLIQVSSGLRGNSILYDTKLLGGLLQRNLGDRYFTGFSHRVPQKPPEKKKKPTPPPRRKVTPIVQEKKKKEKAPTTATTRRRRKGTQIPSSGKAKFTVPTVEMALSSHKKIGTHIVSRRNIDLDRNKFPSEQQLIEAKVDADTRLVFSAERKLLITQDAEREVQEFCADEDNVVRMTIFTGKQTDTAMRLRKLIETKPLRVDLDRRKVLFLLQGSDNVLKGILVCVLRSDTTYGLSPSGGRTPEQLAARNRTVFTDIICVAKQDWKFNVETLLEGTRKILVEAGYDTMIMTGVDTYATELIDKLGFTKQRGKVVGGSRLRLGLDAKVGWVEPLGGSGGDK